MVLAEFFGLSGPVEGPLSVYLLETVEAQDVEELMVLNQWKQQEKEYEDSHYYYGILVKPVVLRKRIIRNYSNRMIINIELLCFLVEFLMSFTLFKACLDKETNIADITPARIGNIVRTRGLNNIWSSSICLTHMDFPGMCEYLTFTGSCVGTL